MSTYEYRVTCQANLQGAEWEGEWAEWEGGQDLTAEQIKDCIQKRDWGGGEVGPVCRALDEALEMSGFDYQVEVREVEQT